MVKKVIELLGEVGKILKALDKRAKDFKPAPTSNLPKGITRKSRGKSRARVIQDQKLILNRAKGRRVGKEERRKENIQLRPKTSEKFAKSIGVDAPLKSRRGQKDVTAIEDKALDDAMALRDKSGIANDEGIVPIFNVRGERIGATKGRSPMSKRANDRVNEIMDFLDRMSRP